MSNPDAPLTPETIGAILDFLLAAARPIFWHPIDTAWPRDVMGATCFALRLADNLTIGVTAGHVIRALERRQKERPGQIIQISTSLASISTIDIDDDLDLATFHWGRVGHQPLDCRGAWPPPSPRRGQFIALVGFPEIERVVRADRSGLFGAWGSLALVEDITEREIIITYDPARELPIAGVAKPPLHLNLSGCSGGVGLLLGERAGLLRWFPVGAIKAGPKEGAQGLFSDIDVIRLARLSVIALDGTIVRPAG